MCEPDFQGERRLVVQRGGRRSRAARPSRGRDRPRAGPGSAPRRARRLRRSRGDTFPGRLLGSPGASTRPPAAIRLGQYEKRSVESCGPTTSPGRTIVARCANALRTICSQAALRAPYEPVLDLRTRLICVHGDARDEQVPTDGVAKCIHGQLHCTRNVRSGVDDCVPGAALKWKQTLHAVSTDLLDAGEQFRVRLPAIEDGHLVTARDRRLDDGAPDEPGPSDDEQPQRMPSRHRDLSPAGAR
jgi:hypothetical protein